MCRSNKFTAIVRKKPSLPMVFLSNNGLLLGDVLDYGCGRGFDVDFFGIDGYDPYWEVGIKKDKKYDTIVCNYVLNVVSEEEQKKIISDIRSLLKPEGKAYFTVRRDIKKDYKVGNYVQRVVILNDALSILKTKGFEIYEYKCVFHSR